MLTNAVIEITTNQLATVDNTVNSVLALIPANQQHTFNLVVSLLASVAFLIRAYVGWQTSGFWGAVKGIFAGTNTPADVTRTPKQTSLLPAILILGATCFLFTGCATQQNAGHQIINNETANGLKMKLPLGYNGNNIFELDLAIGDIKTTTVVQPVAATKLYAPNMAVISANEGKGSINAGISGTNNASNLVGAATDKYVLITGDTHADIKTNSLSASGWETVTNK